MLYTFFYHNEKKVFVLLKTTMRYYFVPTRMAIIKNKNKGASLVAQWLRIRLPVQGIRVRALVREDPTCCEATKPVHHNY